MRLWNRYSIKLDLQNVALSASQLFRQFPLSCFTLYDNFVIFLDQERRKVTVLSVIRSQEYLIVSWQTYCISFLLQVKLVKDKKTEKSKGYAFIEFEREEDMRSKYCYLKYDYE